MILLQFVYSQFQQSSYWWWKMILTDWAWRLLWCGDMKTLSLLHLWQSIYTCNKSLTHQTHLNNQLQTGFRPSAWTECFRCWKGSDNPCGIVYHARLFLHPRSSEKICLNVQFLQKCFLQGFDETPSGEISQVFQPEIISCPKALE